MNSHVARGADSRRREHTQPALRLAVAAPLVFLAGLFVTGLGAGIALRHLAKSGLTTTSVIGVLILVAGIGLVSLAWIEFWRATRRWQRLWLVPLLIVGLLATSSFALGAMLAYGPRTSLGPRTPAGLGLAFTDVTLRTSDGLRLSAWYVPATNHAAILAVPGAGSNRTATLGQATVLARHGYGVLMLDPRGQGRSSGHAMDAGWYGDRDLTAAVSYLQHRADVDPARIGVLGLSMGGEEAIGAAAADPAVRAVVAEGATHRTAADKAGYLPGGVLGALQRGLDQLTYGTAALLSPAPRPSTLHAAIRRASSTRFLLIAGGRAVDEPEATAYLRTAAPSRVQTWTVAGATHTHGLTTAPQAWTARVLAFFDHALRATNGTP